MAIVRYVFLLFPIIVSAQDTIAYSLAIDSLVITAQSTPTTIHQAVQKIRIISRKDLERNGATSLDQVLAQIPSISITEDPILGTYIRMRGMSARNVSILKNGVPVIGRNNGSIDISQLALDNVERIEIVEGPLSTLYGNNASAGVINIITKKSQKHTWNIASSHQIESIGKRYHTATIGYQKNNFVLNARARLMNFFYLPADSLRIIDKKVTPTGKVNRSFRYPYNPKKQHAWGANIRYILGNHDLDADYTFTKEKVTDYGNIKRPTYKPYANDQTYATTRKDISLDYKGSASNSVLWKITLAHNHYDRIRNKRRLYLETQTVDSLYQVADSTRFEQIFANAQVNYNRGKDWHVSVGYNHTYATGSGDRIIARENLDSIRAISSEHSIYSQIGYNGIPNLGLICSGRWMQPNAHSPVWTLSTQAKYNINGKMTIRASYAQGYRSPSIKERYLEFIDINHHIVGNPNLNPEYSHDLQATLNYEPTKEWSGGLNVYGNKTYQRIKLVEFEDFKFRYGNVAQYTVIGFQPTVQYKTKNVKIGTQASMGLWSAGIKHVDAPRFGQSINISNHININNIVAGIGISLQHQYRGTEPSFRTENNMVVVRKIQGYHMINVDAQKSIWADRIQCAIGVRNILDKRTAGINVTTHGNGQKRVVSIGRNIYLRIRARL